jgi:hypothetical protein
VFPTLQGAANAPATAPLNVGDSCLIDEADGPAGTTPGDVLVADADVAAGADPVTVDVSANEVVFVSGNVPNVRVYSRGGGALLRSAALTNALGAGIARVLFDGADIVVVYDRNIECFNATTMATKWVSQIAATFIINDVAWDDVRVYTVSNDPNDELQAFNRTTGALIYSYGHQSVAGPATPLFSVATNGRLVFVAGDPSNAASGATIRAVDAATGADAAGEGGLGTSLLAWDAVQATQTTAGRLLTTDGKSLYVGEGVDLKIRGCGDGVERGGGRSAPFDYRSLVVDQDYIIAAWADPADLPPPRAAANAALVAYTTPLLTEAWRFKPPIATDSAYNIAVSDGATVFAAMIVTGGAVNPAPQIARGNRRPVRFRRVDPSPTGAEKALLMRQLLVPIE